MKVLLIHADGTTSFYPHLFPGATKQTPLQIVEDGFRKAVSADPTELEVFENPTYRARTFLFRSWLWTKRDHLILAIYEEVF